MSVEFIHQKSKHNKEPLPVMNYNLVDALLLIYIHLT